MKFRTTMLSVLGSALAVAMTLAAAPIASAADMIGNCELFGQKGQFPITPAMPGQLTVEVNLPAPGFWNGDTPETIKDGFEYCMAANIAHRAGLDKVEVVNVAWDALVAGQTKDFDLALSQTSITDERKKVVDFSVPYFSSDIGVMVKKGTKVDGDLDQGPCASACSRRPPAPTFVDREAEAEDAGQGVPGHALDVHRAAGQPGRRRHDRHRDRARPGRGLERRLRGGRPVRHRRDLWRASIPRARPTRRRSTRSSRP